MDKTDMLGGKLHRRVIERNEALNQPQTLKDLMQGKIETANGDTSVLKEAQTIIYGDREKTYGHPSKNLTAIASMWNAYLKSVGDRELNAQDVCVMMTLLKCARLANNPTHRDSLVDGAAYLALIERCGDESKSNGSKEMK